MGREVWIEFSWLRMGFRRFETFGLHVSRRVSWAAVLLTDDQAYLTSCHCLAQAVCSCCLLLRRPELNHRIVCVEFVADREVSGGCFFQCLGFSCRLSFYHCSTLIVTMWYNRTNCSHCTRNSPHFHPTVVISLGCGRWTWVVFKRSRPWKPQISQCRPVRSVWARISHAVKWLHWGWSTEVQFPVWERG